jgi:HSP20 family protein
MARFSREDAEGRTDVHRLLLELLDQGPASAIDCVAPMDVVETHDGLHVVLDVPGVSAADLRIVLAGGDLTIAGRKPTCGTSRGEARFHLAERTFGRFVRTLRLDGSFDGARATATLEAGELRIVLPRLEDRRGQPIVVPINVQQPG